MTNVNPETKWQNLIVTDGNYPEGIETTLGELINRGDSALVTCKTRDGAISEWPGYFISAPGEDPDWNTPVDPVDWTGFFQALVMAWEMMEPV